MERVIVWHLKGFSEVKLVRGRDIYMSIQISPNFRRVHYVPNVIDYRN